MSNVDYDKRMKKKKKTEQKHCIAIAFALQESQEKAIKKKLNRNNFKLYVREWYVYVCVYAYGIVRFAGENCNMLLFIPLYVCVTISAIALPLL